MMGRKDLEHPWLYQRCLDIQDEPDGYLDLWARYHFKSTIQTFAKTVQDILSSHGDDPDPKWNGVEQTFCIFSHTRPIAKAFLRQIRDELAGNRRLIELFPDILYVQPDKNSPRWSEDNGLLVRRKNTPREATVEAWGLVDGQPTGKHFNILLYDDIVTLASVSNTDQVQKTTQAWELSYALGDSNPKQRYAGTRYAFADSYHDIIERKAVKTRIFPATHDGTLSGISVLLSPEALRKAMEVMGPYTFSAQMLLNPIANSKQTFLRQWLDHRFERTQLSHQSMTRCLLCDPANAKKKTSDYTTFAVIGLNVDRNYYLLDFVRDRMNLIERTAELFRLHKKWTPQRVGYEQYGKDSDIQHIQSEMDRMPYHFEIEELAGSLSKIDRINRLIPVCAEGRLWLPEAIRRTNHEGKLEELVSVLVEEEFVPWPVPVHDDGLDVIARVFDLENLDFPEPEPEAHKDDRYAKKRRPSGSWMSR
jgi:phage terminase large subunit-like protein